MLFDNSLDGLMLTSPDGTILDANPSACQILGRTREEIIQEGRAGLIDTSDPRLEALIEQRKQTGRAHGELTARRKDGTLFPVEYRLLFSRIPTGTREPALSFATSANERAQRPNGSA